MHTKVVFIQFHPGAGVPGSWLHDGNGVPVMHGRMEIPVVLHYLIAFKLPETPFHFAIVFMERSRSILTCVLSTFGDNTWKKQVCKGFDAVVAVCEDILTYMTSVLTRSFHCKRLLLPGCQYPHIAHASFWASCFICWICPFYMFCRKFVILIPIGCRKLGAFVTGFEWKITKNKLEPWHANRRNKILFVRYKRWYKTTVQRTNAADLSCQRYPSTIMWWENCLTQCKRPPCPIY